MICRNDFFLMDLLNNIYSEMHEDINKLVEFLVSGHRKLQCSTDFNGNSLQDSRIFRYKLEGHG